MPIYQRMRKTAAFLLLLLGSVSFVACRSYPPADVATSAPSSTAGATSTTDAPATTVAEASPTVATTPATTPVVLSPAEASGKLCDAVISGDAAVRAGNYVAGGLRLSGGISNYGEAAAPSVTAAARAMLAAGLAVDEEGYVVARQQAATACAPFGRTVPTGGVQCVTFPCP